ATPLPGRKVQVMPKRQVIALAAAVLAPGYRFNDENLAGETYPAGTVAMANAGPNTNGSQFFFCWKDSSRIPPNYTPFGTVIGGMKVLEKIAAAGDDSQNGPGDGYPHAYTQFNRVEIVF